jgi:hypothetical protein
MLALVDNHTEEAAQDKIVTAPRAECQKEKLSVK